MDDGVQRAMVRCVHVPSIIAVGKIFTGRKNLAKSLDREM